jgi:hypothetical protein
MTAPQVVTGDRVLDQMIVLAGCSMQDRILVAGSKSMELMFELHRRGYALAASAGNCGRADAQYDVALIDWRRRPSRDLEATLDWLAKFIKPTGVVVVWVDAQKPAANQSLRESLEKRGYRIEQGAVYENGCAFVARPCQTTPLKKAA